MPQFLSQNQPLQPQQFIPINALVQSHQNTASHYVPQQNVGNLPVTQNALTGNHNVLPVNQMAHQVNALPVNLPVNQVAHQVNALPVNAMPVNQRSVSTGQQQQSNQVGN